METEKNKSSINMYTNKKHIRIKWTNLCEKNLVCEKIGVPFKTANKKIKTWMGNSTRNADKNYENRQKRWNKGKTQKHVGTKRKKKHKKKKYNLRE